MAQANSTNRLDHLQTYQPNTFPSEPGQRHSAVLIPIIDRPNKQLIYTRRSLNLKNHAGEISFPGGRLEPGETGWQAALREAEEEIGLPQSEVTYLGRLDDVFSPRGFHVECYVGRLPEFELQINQDEVEHVIHVDLEELLDISRHRVEPWKSRQVHFFNFDDAVVWGVTGQITYHLRRCLL